MSDKQAWPADRGHAVIQVLWTGDPSDSVFIGYNGPLWEMDPVEEEIFGIEPDGLFDDGPGDYLLSVGWIPDEIDYSDPGQRVAIPAHLDVEKIDFRPWPEPEAPSRH